MSKNAQEFVAANQGNLVALYRRRLTYAIQTANGSVLEGYEQIIKDGIETAIVALLAKPKQADLVAAWNAINVLAGELESQQTAHKFVDRSKPAKDARAVIIEDLRSVQERITAEIARREEIQQRNVG